MLQENVAKLQEKIKICMFYNKCCKLIWKYDAKCSITVATCQCNIERVDVARKCCNIAKNNIKIACLLINVANLWGNIMQNIALL